jgi:hypothetical protein
MDDEYDEQTHEAQDQEFEESSASSASDSESEQEDVGDNKEEFLADVPLNDIDSSFRDSALSSLQNVIGGPSGPLYDDVIQNPILRSALDSLHDDGEYALEQSTKEQLEMGFVWLQKIISNMGVQWNPRLSPVPVDALLLLLTIAGTEKGTAIGSSALLGAGHSLSQLRKIRAIASHVNEKHGFKKKDIFRDNFELEEYRGQVKNTAHHDRISNAMKKFEKIIARREVQSQSFLRCHILRARALFMEKGLLGLMIYTLVLVSFWLLLRPGVATAIRIDYIELCEGNEEEFGIPRCIKIYLKQEKYVHKCIAYRLWAYPEDPEVCPVLHLLLLLKITKWEHGYLFRRPFSIRSNLKPDDFSVCEHIPKACYSRIYLSVFKKIFPNQTENRLTTYGPRRSGAQFLDRKGKSMYLIMKFGQWRTLRASSRYVAGSRVDMSMLQDEADKKDFPDPLPIMVDSAYEESARSF